jgi:hypothetical protein
MSMPEGSSLAGEVRIDLRQGGGINPSLRRACVVETGRLVRACRPH